MSRTFFALSVMLLTFAGSLVVLRSAHGQTTLDARLGGAYHGLCPLLGDEIYNCGLGVSSRPYDTIGLRQARRACGLGELVCPWIFGDRAQQAAREVAAPVTNLVQSARQQIVCGYQRFLAGHDPVYDAAVYGVVSPDNEHSALATTAAPANVTNDRDTVPELGYIFFLPDPPEQTTFVYDGCEYGALDGCWPGPRPMATAVADVTANAAPAAPAAPAPTRSKLDAEPHSLADYYALYGNRVADWWQSYISSYPAVKTVPATDHSAAADAFDTLCRLPGDLARSVRELPLVADLQCRWQGWVIQARRLTRSSTSALASRYQQWQAAARPAVANLAAPASAPAATAPADVETTLATRRQSAREQRKQFVRSLARSLDHAGRMLQNASQQLEGLIHDETVEVLMDADQVN